ncbi:MAG TPA: carboxymuconolactone decarboxylase family protein [Candidatus Kapabacteria bacterium]|nr:carboxymuconolactone decarboxylase family protein [Candidatus Kapabacteria bacterium]
MKIFEEFDSRRNSGNKLVLSQDYLPFKRFYSLDANAYNFGAMEEKVKELMGLSCSMVLRCNDCILYHLRNAYSLGASLDEINETMNIALVVGGTVVIPHLRFALAALEELKENQ